MKNTKSSFCCLFSVVISALFFANAKAEDYADGGICGDAKKAGYTCNLTRHKECPEDCYCPGTGGYSSATIGVLAGRCKGTDSKYGYGAYVDGGAYRCPEDFPKSHKGQKSADGCYRLDKDKKEAFKGKTYRCLSGEYLPENSITCKECKTGNYVCKGGDFYFSLNDGDKGLDTCNSDETPNREKTKCEKKITKYKCDPGTYLPANRETCAVCLENSFCEGGEWEKTANVKGLKACPTERPKSQPGAKSEQECFSKKECTGNTIFNTEGTGCATCDSGYEPNEDHTKCIQKAPETIVVQAGKYLRAGETTESDCPKDNVRKYCPGGEFTKQNKDQGYVDCPLNGRSTDKKNCFITITKDQMKYGPNGKDTPTASQCWTQIDPVKYQACVFGIKLQED